MAILFKNKFVFFLLYFGFHPGCRTLHEPGIWQIPVSDYFEAMKRLIAADFIVRHVFDCPDLLPIDVLCPAASAGEHIRGLAAGLPRAWWTRHHAQLSVWDGGKGIHQLLGRNPTAGLCVLYPGHTQHQRGAGLHGQTRPLHRQTYSRLVYMDSY